MAACGSREHVNIAVVYPGGEPAEHGAMMLPPYNNHAPGARVHDMADHFGPVYLQPRIYAVLDSEHSILNVLNPLDDDGAAPDVAEPLDV